MDSKGRILIVDDEEGIREGCRRALEPHGLTIATASTIHEGQERIQQGNFDLVLLDIMLPDGRGTDMLAPIREHDPEIVCVIITGYATVELAVEAIRRGAYDFIAKPFTSDVLLMKVNQGLERRRLSLESKRLEALEKEAQELARDRAELERLDQLKSTLMLTVAHELRAPIAALQSFLWAMLKGYVAPQDRESALRRAFERGRELLELVDDLLFLGTVEERQAKEGTEIISLVDTLKSAYSLFEAQAEHKGLAYTLTTKRCPLVRANAEHLRQVWTNLISNAIKYTPDRGEVRITLDECYGWAVGSVEDTGIGVAAGDQSRVFEGFYRTPEAKKMSARGTGLGLAIVKRVVESHGGSIELASERGQGSRFRFRLPVAA